MKHLLLWLSLPLLFPLCAAASEVNITADKIVRDAEGVATATGSVEIKRDGEMLQADKVRYDATGKRIMAEGNLHITSEKADVHASSGEMSTENKTGELHNAEIQLPGGERLQATRLLRINEYTYQAFQPVVTTCPKDEETWHLYASEGVLDQKEGVFTAKHARLEVAGVPVFYSPYWQQAIRRKSGFLIPSVSIGKRRGTEWSLPYYFAPRPDWDATITPHYMTARGMMLEGELRHASSVGAEQLRLEGLHDKVLNRSRSRVQGNGRWELPLDMHLSVKGDEVAERNYLADFSHDSTQSALRYLTSMAQLSQDIEYGSWSLAGIYNHDLSSISNKATLQQYPNFNLDLDVPLSDSPATLHLVQNTTRFSNSDGANAIRDWRAYTHPYITIPWVMLDGGISSTLTAGTSYTRYWLNQGVVRKPHLQSGEFSLDSSMAFERINDSHTVRHSIIPRLRYDFNAVSSRADVPNFDTTLNPLRLSNLFSGNRFSGMDNVERSNRISFLLSNNFETKSSPDKPARTVFSISGGAQYNMRTSFNASADPNAFSNLLGLMTASPLPNTSASLEDEYNPTRSFINRIAGTVSAHDAAGDAFSASYVVNATELGATSEILQATGKLALGKRWGISGSINYDMLQKFTQQMGLSLAYTHPCWDITLAAHRTNRPTGTSNGQDIGASLLIGFKGLGSVASNEE